MVLERKIDEHLKEIEEALERVNKGYMDLLDEAYRIICNVNEGAQPPEWREAAARFREKWHSLLSEMRLFKEREKSKKEGV